MTMDSGGIALDGLNHRLGLSQASGLQKPIRSTFAEVSFRMPRHGYAYVYMIS